MSTGRDPIRNWQQKLTTAEIDHALEILRATGMDAIYHDDPMPTPEGIERLRGYPGSPGQTGESA